MWGISFGGDQSNDIGYGLSVTQSSSSSSDQNGGLLLTGFFQAKSMMIPSSFTESGEEMLVGYVNPEGENDLDSFYDIQNGYILQVKKELNWQKIKHLKNLEKIIKVMVCRLIKR